jgi:hypothetical protein
MNSNVRNITGALGKNSNFWAFTGSVALWYHSVNRNMEPRAPHDIDIVIEKSARSYVISVLSALGWTMQSEGSARITFKKGTKHLDLIFAGSRLGPSLNSVTRYRNSPPIINVQSLFNRKKMITPNAKTRANLSRLRNLGGVTPRRSNRNNLTRAGRGKKLVWN